MTGFPDYLDVDYTDGEGESPEDYPTLDAKIEKAIEVTRRGLEQYRNPAVAWTGGKDSTLVLYFVLEVAEEYGFDLPPAVFIDHFEHFPEVFAFVERWADEWGLDLCYARNEEFARLDAQPGDEIALEGLSESTRRELRERLEYAGETLRFSADSYEGNHLLKTVAFNESVREHGFDGVFSGVRWDEQEARADETFFSPRHDPDVYPPHDRIHSILQFDEAAVWDAFWYVVVPETVEGYPEEGHVPRNYDDLPEGITREDLPVSPKYFEGFRSLGSEHGSAKSDDRPAWLQDLDNTAERAGRAQDKEDLMGRLRDLGYM
ncbi:phosphoadenosine phosphosulfate reductase family protein [Halalkalicoccus salilacus]|uniref:phosphoadenosine phosphosulfate reductase family protein n=1 Tax=Halalkalicoccus salilacus TaxID=3117459 RepID=UPI00300ECC4E